MDDVAMAIGHDLKFDVPWVDDELFQVDLVASKSFLRLMTRAMESRFETWLIVRSAHSATAAAGSRLDHHRIAKLLCDSHRLLLRLDDAIAPGRHRNAGSARSRPSSVLVAHRLHRTGGGPNELNVAAFAHFHEMRILSEESIARMDGIYVADLGGAHDPIDP